MKDGLAGGVKGWARWGGGGEDRGDKPYHVLSAGAGTCQDLVPVVKVLASLCSILYVSGGAEPWLGVSTILAVQSYLTSTGIRTSLLS